MKKRPTIFRSFTTRNYTAKWTDYTRLLYKYTPGTMVAMVILTLIVLSIPAGVNAVSVVKVKQVIRQISCVLTTVIHNDGSTSYVLSPGCGYLVSPLKQQSLTKNKYASPFALPTEGEAAKLFLRQQAIFLSSDPVSQPPGGYVLLAPPNTRYAFRLTGESNMLHDRTLEVISVDTDSITVRFWPEGKQVVIHLNETVKVQVAYDATPDVIMTLMQLNADGSVLLRVRFPEQKQLAETAKGQGDVFAATVIGLVATTLLICIYIDYWLLARRKLPPKYWWPVHQHEPFEKYYINRKC